MKKSFYLIIAAMLGIFSATAQTYEFKPIKGFKDATNEQLEAFLESTVPMKTRKVAVFDCDGTLFGQAPYYLADEALYDFAKRNYEGKTDSLSVAKMKIVDELLHGDNVGVDFVQNRVRFLSGLTADQIQAIGNDMFHEKYQNKMYPEMKSLIANLENYGFEVWILSASPELLYQRFCAEQLGLPEDRIIGVKSRVGEGNIVTDELVYPVSQDEGKADVVRTFIKADPLFVGGNSRGDLEMMNTSVGLKIMINPDDKKPEKVAGGKTIKQYWESDPRCIIEYCNDVPTEGITYVTQEWGVKNNATNAKPSEVVINY
ncbi:MAG: haloacid dehalogenase-like hydrolase [Muribaculaceae bacterium]|nr:haloacid dehalogenase-like hydrolase [Muribaculaceae bacterium]MDE6754034.1 haloacid dehalogenase-like hydrolase [Muribaculaceae bacterium]